MSVWMILGEAALRQQYGGSDVLAEQLDHLTEIAQLPNVTLQVLSFAAGAYPGGPYPFSVYSFPKPSSMEVVVLENHTSQLYLETPEDTQYYGDVFDRLRASALGPIDSKALISDIVHDVRRERESPQMHTEQSGWFKSSYSGQNGNCVEVRFRAGGGVDLRDSKAPRGRPSGSPGTAGRPSSGT